MMPRQERIGSIARGPTRKARTMRAVWLVCLGLGLVMLLRCRTVRVHTDWDPGVSFADFQQYAWLEPPEVEGANPFADNSLLRKRLRHAIEFGVAARGYRMVDAAEEADFLVTYSVVLNERIEDHGSVSAGFGYGYYRRYGFGPSYSSPSIRNYQESTLIIDIVDPVSMELLWRGWGSGVVGTRDRDRSGERVQDGVRQILAKFPPEPSESYP